MTNTKPLLAAALFVSLACLHCLAPSGDAASSDDDPSPATRTEALTTSDSTGTTTTTDSTLDGTKKDGGSTSGPYYDFKLVDLTVAH